MIEFNDILIGLSIIIATIVASVLVVSHLAYKRGKESGHEIGYEKGTKEGVIIGREQILLENLVRSDLKLQEEIKHQNDLNKFIGQLSDERS